MTNTKPAPAPELLEIAASTRRMLQTVLQASGLSSDPAGACAFGSFLVREGVNRFTPHRARICGGSGEQAGLRDQAGALQGHYWVEVEISGAPDVLIDVTADQFGWPAIVCEDRKGLGDRYIAGDQQEIDEHMEALASWIAGEPISLSGPCPAGILTPERAAAILKP